MESQRVAPRSAPALPALLAGKWASDLGSAANNLVLPTIAVVTLQGGALQVGIILFIRLLSFAILGIPAGVLIDRRSRRFVLFSSNLIRTLVVASIPAAYASGHLTILQVDLAVALTGFLADLTSSTSFALLPGATSSAKLQKSIGKMIVSETVSSVAGPALAGILIIWISPPFATLIESAAAAICGLLSLVLPALTAEEVERRSLNDQIGQGFSAIRRSPTISGIVISAAILSFASFAAYTNLYPFAYHSLGLRPADVGIAMAFGSLVTVLSATLCVRTGGQMNPQLRAGRGLGILCVGWLILSFGGPALPLPCLFVGLGLDGIGYPMFNFVWGVMRQASVDPKLHGRVVATGRAITGGAAAFGALLGGAVGSALNAPLAMEVAAILFVAGFAWQVTRRLPATVPVYPRYLDRLVETIGRYEYARGARSLLERYAATIDAHTVDSSAVDRLRRRRSGVVSPPHRQRDSRN